MKQKFCYRMEQLLTNNYSLSWSLMEVKREKNKNQVSSVVLKDANAITDPFVTAVNSVCINVSSSFLLHLSWRRCEMGQLSTTKIVNGSSSFEGSAGDV